MTKKIILMVGVLLLLGGGYLAYHNHQESARQAAAIVARDGQGQDSADQIIALKSYVKAHTWAGVSFNLEAAYARAQEAAKQRAAAAAANTQLYSTAQQACAGRTDSITQSRCVQDYVSKRLTSAPVPTQVPAPQAADFSYSLASTVWAPDGAGALLLGGLAAIVSAIVMGLRPRRRAW